MKREWISIEERKPDNFTRVLVCYRSLAGTMFITIGFYSPKDEFVNTADSTYPRIRSSVLFWMPLPELPIITNKEK